MNKKILLFLLLLLGTNILMLIFPERVFAGTITQVSYGVSGATVGTYVGPSVSNFVTFTPIIALILDSTVTITFPSGTTLTSANIATSDFRVSQASDGILCVTAGSDTAPSAVSVNATNRTITFTLASGSLSKTVLSVNCGLGLVTIKTSSTAGSNEIQHPTTTTSTGTLQIDTSLPDTGSISTVSFVADVASQLAFSTQPSSSATAGTNFTTQPVVVIQDQYSNTITGSSASVTLSAVLASDGTTAGGGTLNATTNPITASAGVATFAGVNYTKAEDIKLKVTSSGLTQVLSNTISVAAAAASSLSRTSGNSQSGTVSSALSNPFIVTVTDAYSNVVSGTTVTFAIASTPSGATGTSLSTSSTSTNSSGQASTTLTLGNVSGTYTVTASVSGLTSVTFSVTANSSPSVSSITASSKGQGAESQSLTVTGSGFESGATVSFSGSGITVNSATFVSATSLTVNITITSTATTGTRSVTVTNSDGGTSTGSNLFTVNSKPSISSLSISRLDRGDSNHDITITGTGFSGSSLDFGSGVTVSSTTVVSSTQITAKLSVASDATYGSRDVRVTNSDGGKSEAASFKVAPELTITNIKTANNSSTTTTITWTTSNIATTKVVYGTSTAYGKTIEDNTKVLSHSTTLTNLPTYWVHHFRITAEDEYGQTKESDDQLFTAGLLVTKTLVSTLKSVPTTKVSSPKSAETKTTTSGKSQIAEKIVEEVQGGMVTVEIAVFDDHGNPVPGAKVEIHSTPRIAYTDKDGIAKFAHIEKGKHTMLIAYKGLFGKRGWEVQAASVDNDGTPLQKVAVKMNPSLNAPEGWFSTFLFGIFGGLIGALIIAFIIRHQFSKGTIIGFVGFILIPLILVLVWIVYSWWYQKR